MHFYIKSAKIIKIIPFAKNLYFMSLFREHYLPVDTKLAGLAYIAKELSLNTPLKEFKVISNKVIKGNVQSDGLWTTYSKSYWPGPDLFHHLVFALKYETLNPLALKMIFEKIDSKKSIPPVNWWYVLGPPRGPAFAKLK